MLTTELRCVVIVTSLVIGTSPAQQPAGHAFFLIFRQIAPNPNLSSETAVGRWLVAQLLVDASVSAPLARRCVNARALASGDSPLCLAVLYLPAYAMVAPLVPAFPGRRAIIAETEIGRASHGHVDAIVIQRLEHLAAVALQNHTPSLPVMATVAMLHGQLWLYHAKLKLF